MAPKRPATQTDTDNTETNDVKVVDGVEVYEPHQDNKPTFNRGDVAYGVKKPCMLADGTYPETVADGE